MNCETRPQPRPLFTITCNFPPIRVSVFLSRRADHSRLDARHRTNLTHLPAPRTISTARIYTNDPQHPWASAIGGPCAKAKIVCIGGIEQYHARMWRRRRKTPKPLQTRANKFVMPGFNDAHVHLGNAAADLLAPSA